MFNACKDWDYVTTLSLQFSRGGGGEINTRVKDVHLNFLLISFGTFSLPIGVIKYYVAAYHTAAGDEVAAGNKILMTNYKVQHKTLNTIIFEIF